MNEAQRTYLEQCRRVNPEYDVQHYEKPYGVIVEVRDGSRSIAIWLLDATGNFIPDTSVI